MSVNPNVSYSGNGDVCGPPSDGIAVTPDNTDPLPNWPARALWIGGAGSGNLKIMTPSGNTVTYKSVPTGRFEHLVKQVFATGTDVTDIVAQY